MRITEAKMEIRESYPRPFVKWAGGKTQLLSRLITKVPSNFSCYYEPFLGGGALFFSILPERAVLADKNWELINAYIIIRDHVEELIESLKKHKNEKEYFYYIRSLDPNNLSPVERASRFIYLNKTCYNGLWRVNSKGKFNVPFGRYKNPKICDEPNLRTISEVLKDKTILCADFEEAVAKAKRGDFIYFDPPYFPLNPTASFTKYTKEDFNIDDQKRLAAVFEELDKRGCFVLLSNSDTDTIRTLYKGYNIQRVEANRFINCKGSRRKGVYELIISNY